MAAQTFKSWFSHVVVDRSGSGDRPAVLLRVPSGSDRQECARLFAPEVARELGQALIDLAEEIENPPVEVFQPGDRLRHSGQGFEITLADAGFIQHFSTGGNPYFAYSEGPDGQGFSKLGPGGEFTSAYYEKVN